MLGEVSIFNVFMPHLDSYDLNKNSKCLYRIEGRNIWWVINQFIDFQSCDLFVYFLFPRLRALLSIYWRMFHFLHAKWFYEKWCSLQNGMKWIRLEQFALHILPSVAVAIKESGVEKLLKGAQSMVCIEALTSLQTKILRSVCLCSSV